MTGRAIWRDMTKFWGKLFGINFAMGVATGITMEFQFGTNWAYYSHYVGDIFGAPLAIEGLMAFFLEATFVGLFFFGWNKLSLILPAHAATGSGVAVGAWPDRVSGSSSQITRTCRYADHRQAEECRWRTHGVSDPTRRGGAEGGAEAAGQRERTDAEVQEPAAPCHVRGDQRHHEAEHRATDPVQDLHHHERHRVRQRHEQQPSYRQCRKPHQQNRSPTETLREAANHGREQGDDDLRHDDRRGYHEAGRCSCASPARSGRAAASRHCRTGTARTRSRRPEMPVLRRCATGGGLAGSSPSGAVSQGDRPREPDRCCGTAAARRWPAGREARWPRTPHGSIHRRPIAPAARRPIRCRWRHSAR